MISLDRGLLGKGELGDVTSRHKEYGQYVQRLDIIVFSRKGYLENKISETVSAYPTNSNSKFNYLFNAYQIGRELFSHNAYDLVVTQAPFISGLIGYWLAKKFRAKLLIHFHGDYVKNKQWLKERWYNFLMVPISNFLAKRADGIRVMSSGIKEKLVANGVSENKIKVISTPISLVKFGRWDANKAAGLKNQYHNKKIILSVGRLEKEKDLPTLFSALVEVKKNYSDFILLILGDGSLKADWQLLVEQLGLENEIVFLGQAQHEDLVNYYQACDFIINCSTSESFGKVLVEAAACNKPAIATSTTGAREIIIDGQTGLLSPIGDSASLAVNILKLLTNGELTKDLGLKAKEISSKRFDGGINTQEIIKFWQELIDSKI
jgi:glycosyltransferase involved in cell wall biosynthesis